MSIKITFETPNAEKMREFRDKLVAGDKGAIDGARSLGITMMVFHIDGKDVRVDIPPCPLCGGAETVSVGQKCICKY